MLEHTNSVCVSYSDAVFSTRTECTREFGGGGGDIYTASLILTFFSVDASAAASLCFIRAKLK